MVGGGGSNNSPIAVLPKPIRFLASETAHFVLISGIRSDSILLPVCVHIQLRVYRYNERNRQSKHNEAVSCSEDCLQDVEQARLRCGRIGFKYDARYIFERSGGLLRIVSVVL